MRISAGSAKGRQIRLKKGLLKRTEEDDLRPTSSKVREAIFDILRDEINGAAFLDLYAGTGAVGIEALSRGAGRVTFVESDIRRAGMIKDLVAKFNFKDRADVVKADAVSFIRKGSEKGLRHNIIFLDPPYRSGELAKALPLLGEGGLLEENAVVMAEHSSVMQLPDVIGRLRLLKRYKYGDTALSRYSLEEQ